MIYPFYVNLRKSVVIIVILQPHAYMYIRNGRHIGRRWNKRAAYGALYRLGMWVSNGPIAARLYVQLLGLNILLYM